MKVEAIYHSQYTRPNNNTNSIPLQPRTYTDNDFESVLNDSMTRLDNNTKSDEEK